MRYIYIIIFSGLCIVISFATASKHVASVEEIVGSHFVRWLDFSIGQNSILPQSKPLFHDQEQFRKNLQMLSPSDRTKLYIIVELLFELDGEAAQAHNDSFKPYRSEIAKIVSEIPDSDFAQMFRKWRIPPERQVLVLKRIRNQ